MDRLPDEKDFQRAVLKKLRTIPFSWWIKINDRTMIGVPDILGSVAGIFVAIELKTKSKVTAIQAYTLRRIDQTGAQSFVVNPENWPEIFKYLLKLSELGPKNLQKP